MKHIVGVSFTDNDRITYYYIDNNKIKPGYNVLVRTDRGLEFAKVKTDIHPIDPDKLSVKLNTIERVASKEDFYINKENIKLAKEAFKKCEQLLKKYKLEMKLIDASYTFDRDQLMIKFYSDVRIDFRDLAKELASIYKTRIELSQIGVRDKAKEIGGYGSCGQPLCCSRYLNDFESVSIAMAKNQNLSLNPSKINGLCGRLLCCLKYEDECYKNCQKKLPNVGKEINIGNETRKVISVDVLNRKYKVLLPNGNIIEEKVSEDA